MDYPTACEQFLSEQVRAQSTIANYRRAITLFMGGGDGPRFTPAPLPSLGADDRAILVHFVQWLLKERGFAPATAALYITAIRKWFEWMAVNDILPPTFPLEKAKITLRVALRASIFKKRPRAPEPPTGIRDAIAYFDTLSLPESLHSDQERAFRWALEKFRNMALMRVLGETGGRISEILSLRVGDFPQRAFDNPDQVWRILVVGKNDYEYYLRFKRSLPYIKRYLDLREPTNEKEPLFLTHSKRYGGQAMSRQSAWLVVDEARQALGLSKISPHDFRHWRATELVEDGQPLDVIQEYLGHRSVETTRAYYVHTRAARVDEAVK